MKRTLSIITMLFICLTLCSCSNSASVENALQGTWISENGDGGIYIFDNGNFSCETVISGMSLGAKEGKYKISSNTIKLSYDNGVDAELEFIYKNGILSIDGLSEQSLIDEALQGKWVHDGVIYMDYTFNNGNFTSNTVFGQSDLGPDKGVYEISAGFIILRYDDGSEDKLDFSYKDGNLTIDDLIKE